MAKGKSNKGGKKRGQMKRVEFRPNRQKPSRQKRWEVTGQGDEDAPVEDAVNRETVRAKGALSRKRTVIENDTQASQDHWHEGRAIAVRGQFVEVDDGQRVWPCTVRRILRTRRIGERSPVAVGDKVSFSIVADSEGVLNEGVIERVHERISELKRSDGRKTHLIAANVDQVVIVGSIREPMLKPHLIDRYLVAAHAGNMAAVVCINKVDLIDPEDMEIVEEVLDLYRGLGYQALATSAEAGVGVDELRTIMQGAVTLVAGQSGVGKSSLLNAVHPGLNLKTGAVSESTEKGRHTTTTAVWHKLDFGGAVVDTPGIRALDIAMVPLHELEMHFVEFVDLIPHCKFPDCVHIHEKECAIRTAVEEGVIDEQRYESYVQLFHDRSEQGR